MIELPWWTKSPSPMSLGFWFFLSLYGAYKLHPTRAREWLSYFGHAAFILGLVVLPFDALWCIFQGLRFSHLHPEGVRILALCLVRDVAGTLWCWIETRNHFAPKGRLNKKRLLWVAWFIPYFTLFFVLAPNPSWTDWTYALRFSYGNMRALTSYLLGVPMKAVQAFIYIKLWK